MVKFEDNELEAAIITYNRPVAIEVTLEKYAQEYIRRNIKLSVYDSSEENDTFEVVRKFNERNSNYVEYHKVDSSIAIGDKPIVAIMGSKCNYIWVQADKRTVNFHDLDKYIFPKIKENSYTELIMVTEEFSNKNNLSIEKEFANYQECLIKTVVEQSWAGKTILKTDVFSRYSLEKVIENIKDEFHDELSGYRFLAFIMLVISKMKHEFRAYVHRVNVDFYLDNSVKSWNAHFYRYLFGEWVVLWKYITKGLQNSDDLVKKYFSSQDCKECLFTESALYFGRVNADLNEVYDEFVEKKYFDYTPVDKSLLEFYAKAPIDKVKRYYLYDRRYECVDNELVIGIKTILSQLRQTTKKIYIYGAGYGGKIVLEALKRENIPVSGFVDKNAKYMEPIENINVFTLNEIDSSNSILIISLKKIVDEVANRCMEFGFGDNMYYLCDIIARPEEYTRICNE